MGPEARAQAQMHFCVVLWGFTAILGKWISLPATVLVFWRMVMVVGVLLALPSVRREARALPRRTALSYAGVGTVHTMHWVTFYGSIKLANASVASSCMALSPVFLALVEPWIARRRFDARELLLGVLAVPGVALVVGGVPTGKRIGVAVGALSALLVAITGSLNKRLVTANAVRPLTITCVELGAGVGFLALLGLARVGPAPWSPVPGARDATLLLVLATACTIVPFALSLAALRHLSAYRAQLTVNLEPLYAVALAAVLLGDRHELAPSFYAGVAIVLGVVFAYPVLTRRGGV
jgi:drug/metabolite transporter (DMT)-like permease